MAGRNPMEKNLLCIFIIIVAGIALSAVVILQPHTDPAPPQVRAGWYMPSRDIVWTIPGPGPSPGLTERFIRTGERDAPAPQFPALSPYSRYINYSREGSDTRYMIAVWYFTDENSFRDAKKALLASLAVSGQSSAASLNLTQQTGLRGNPPESLRTGSTPAAAPSRLSATGYQGNTTAGYFFSVTRDGSWIPDGDGIIPAGKECYLVYYGTITPSDLASQSGILGEFIAETYTFDRVVSQDPL